MADHRRRHGSEPDRARRCAGHADDDGDRPDRDSADRLGRPGTSSLNWIYAFNDVTFEQSVTVALAGVREPGSPPRAHGDDRRDDPASARQPVAPEQGRRRARPLRSTTRRTQIGHVLETATRRTARRASTSRATARARTRPRQHLPCAWGSGRRRLRRPRHGNGRSRPASSRIPKLTCCAPYRGSHLPPEPVTSPPTPSVMGFWYRNASTRAELALRDVERHAAQVRQSDRRRRPDNSINQSATAARPPFDLTGAPYSCKTGQGELS